MYQIGKPMSLCRLKVAITSLSSATASGVAARKASQSRRVSASDLFASDGGYMTWYRLRDHRRVMGTAREQEVSMPASLANFRSCHVWVDWARSEANVV